MKIRNKPKGNIIFLALFVLLASGIIGVLISLMMKDFLRYHNALLAYTKSASLAKGAGELALAMIHQKQWGFDFEVDLQNTKQEEKADQPSPFLINNFACPFPTKENETCPVHYGLSLNIKGTKTLNGEKIEIPAGLSHIITAFTLETPANISAWLWDLKIENTLEQLDDAIPYDEEGKKYLIFVNKDPKEKKIISPNTNGDAVSSENIFITAKGEYQGTIVEKRITATNEIPNFLKGDNYLTTKAN